MLNTYKLTKITENFKDFATKSGKISPKIVTLMTAKYYVMTGNGTFDFINGLYRPLSHSLPAHQTKATISATNKCAKISSSITVLGFELMTKANLTFYYYFSAMTNGFLH